ncbi:DUF2085 domain-containing protein [candidate division KSB1 bacterium]|nr:DUF2085 domain-containing protein [candidate division KSB1 bacterium]
MKTSNLHKAYIIILIGTIAWCLLFVAAPMLAHARHYFSSGFIYLFFSKVCHQLPDRCFLCDGHPFAVCARCTGIYVGFLLGALFYPLFASRMAGSRIIIIIFGVVLTSTLIDVVGNYLRWWQNNAWTRAALGGGIGILLACIIIPGILSIIKVKGELEKNGELPHESKTG